MEKEHRAKTNGRANFGEKESLHTLEKLKVPNHEPDAVSEENRKDQGVHKDLTVKKVQTESKERPLLEMAN